MDGGFVAYGEFVEARGHGSVSFESVDAALHGVALFVDLRVESGWSAASGAKLTAVGVLVGLARDGRGDSTLAQVGAVRPGGVRLVGQDPPRSGSRPTDARAGHADSVQDRDELRAVATLPRGEHDGEGFLALLTCQMQLRGQPATGTSEGVIGRFDGDTAGWFGLQIPLFLAPAACW